MRRLPRSTGRAARALFAEPVVGDVAVSPDGTHISYVRHRRLGDAVVARRLGGGTDRTVAAGTGQIGSHTWTADGAAVVYVAAQEREGLFAVDVTDGTRTEVGPPDAAELYLIDPGEPRLLGPLVAVRDDDGQPLLYRVRGPRGPAEPLDLDRVVTRWFLDPDDRVRAGTSLGDDGVLRVYAGGPGNWAEVLRVPPPRSLSTHPVDVSATGTELLLGAPDDDGRMCLRVLDLASGTLRTVASDPDLHLDYVLLHPLTREPQLLVYSGPRPVYRAPDPAVGADLDRLRRVHAGDPHILARSRDDQTWIVRLDTAYAPSAHLAWRRPAATGEMAGDAHPRLRRRRLASSEPVALRARDGVELVGYLTRPERSRRRPPPLVLLVHGGPWDRDAWEFVPEEQWLAARGYACLRVNFRGSLGGSLQFVDGADRDWGGRPQDDLEDAADWAVRAGHGDPDRLAIMGRSYGGYAALVAATARPKRFACAVAESAPTDLPRFVAHVRRSRLPTRAVFAHRIGDAERDADLLTQRSPTTHAHACHTPVLLAHGRLDGLVPADQAERFAAAAGHPARTLMFDSEGHGITGTGARVRFARAVASFLREHLDR